MKHVVFDRVLSTSALPYLADHRKQGTTVFPATAYLEMGLAAAGEIFGSGPHRFEDLVISAPLTTPAGEDFHVQVIITPESADAATYQLFGRQPGDETWEQHATGTLRRGSGPARAAADSRGDAGPMQETGGEPATYYAAMRGDGHEFGRRSR